MRQSLFGGFVLAALILTSGRVPESAVAQVKDKAVRKDDRRDDRAAIIEISKGKDDKFRFFVRDHEGKLLAMSSPSGFATPKDAEVAIDHLKEVIGRAKVSVVEKKHDNRDKKDK